MFRRTRWSAHLQIGFGLVILGLVLYGAVQQWPRIQPVLAELRWGWMAGVMLVQMGCLLVLPGPLWVWLASQQKTFTFLEAARIFFLSQPAKYLPGGIWAFPAKGLLLKQRGFSNQVTAGAILYETLALCSGALVLGSLASDIAIVDLRWIAAGGVVLGWVAMLILLKPPGALARLPEKWRLASSEPITLGAAAWKATLSLAVASAGWVLAGAAFYMTLLALGVPPGADIALVSIASFAISWLLGFVVFLSPGGVGVREASLVLLAGGAVAAPILYPAAILSRLLWSLGELMLYFYFSGPWRRPPQKNA
ncbi:MAG: flippase-like domain-containing protein [Anaerolineales bacterium]|nr:MAG: flippase-like domain-containing protein [Anaerolineales bacterium]